MKGPVLKHPSFTKGMSFTISMRPGAHANTGLRAGDAFQNLRQIDLPVIINGERCRHESISAIPVMDTKAQHQ